MLFGRPVSHPGPARAQPIERHAQWPAGKTHSFDGKWQFASGPESHQVTLQSVEIAVPMCCTTCAGSRYTVCAGSRYTVCAGS